MGGKVGEKHHNKQLKNKQWIHQPVKLDLLLGGDVIQNVQEDIGTFKYHIPREQGGNEKHITNLVLAKLAPHFSSSSTHQAKLCGWKKKPVLRPSQMIVHPGLWFPPLKMPNEKRITEIYMDFTALRELWYSSSETGKMTVRFWLTLCRNFSIAFFCWSCAGVTYRLHCWWHNEEKQKWKI